jgi:hypothetical protein
MPRVVPGALNSESRPNETGPHGRSVDVPTTTEKRPAELSAVVSRLSDATPRRSSRGAHEARVLPPLLDAVVRRQHCRLIVGTASAARMLEKGSGLGMFHDPRGLAKYNGFNVRVRSNDEERTTAEAIVLTWSWCQRERGIRVQCGLARAYLLRERIAHHDVDVWLMALELAVPHGALFVGVDQIVARQRHCPEDIIRSLVIALD